MFSTGAAVGAAFTANLGAAAAAAGTAVTSGLGAAASLLSSAAAGAGSGGSTPGDEAPGGCRENCEKYFYLNLVYYAAWRR